MTDIAQFILARLDEYEQRAAILADRQRGRWTDEVWDSASYPDSPGGIRRSIEAQRKIIAEMVPMIDGMDDLLREQIGFGAQEFEPASMPLLRILAEPYSDHDDYDQAWRTERQTSSS